MDRVMYMHTYIDIDIWILQIVITVSLPSLFLTSVSLVFFHKAFEPVHRENKFFEICSFWTCKPGKILPAKIFAL